MNTEERPIGDSEVTPASAADDTKHCPMCGATINSVARNCRFCGESLDGHISEAGVWRLGNQLVMRKGAKLPGRCIKTNLPAERWLTRRLYWHHPFYYFLIGGGVLLYVVAVCFVRQNAAVEVGLTQSRYSRRIWTICTAWIGVLTGMAISFVGLSGQGIDAGVLFVAGLFLAVLSAVVGAYLSAVVQPVRITADYVWIKGVHPAFLKALPEFPGEH